MEKKSPEKKSGSSTSFKIGAIALTFLIIGYQAAVFIHRAAILRIESLRDRPDTVYIVRGEADSPKTGIPTMDRAAGGRSTAKAEKPDTFRRNAEHSRIVRNVRSQTRKAENFRFNPNEAPVEDLVRLGFSEKQAAAIDRYRRSGGRFRRKEDFARSFVVSEEIYGRLEPYIDIPLTDINEADSAAFDALPGIGPYFASRMVEYRRRLGGYSYTEQLLDIRNFGEERYEKLKGLITCSPPAPYRLWSLPADSLRLHPYIGGWQEARGIIRFREHSPADSLTADALGRAGILTADNAVRLSRCVIAPPERESGTNFYKNPTEKFGNQ